MFIINIILLILGMVMEPGAILTLMLPVLLPIADTMGYNLVYFGVVVVLNLMIGQVTPLRRVPVCHFGREQDQAGTHLQVDPALPGSVVDHAGCHLYLPAGRYLPAGYAAGCNGCVKTYIFKSD